MDEGFDSECYRQFDYRSFGQQPDWYGFGYADARGPPPPWLPPPWLHHQRQAGGDEHQRYRPRPFPTGPQALKRQAPWPSYQLQPKQRVESNEKSFTMPEDAPENFVELVNSQRCELCKASINSVVNAEMHFNGKTHQKRLKEKGLPVGEYFSGILKIQPASVPTVAQAAEESAPRESALKGPSGLPDLPEGLETDCCRLCNVTFTNTIQAHQHYAGKKHRANAFNGRKIAMSKQAAPKVFRCDLCDVVTNSQGALASHMSGQKHKMNERHRDAKLALQQRQQQKTQSGEAGGSGGGNIAAFLSGMRSASSF